MYQKYLILLYRYVYMTAIFEIINEIFLTQFNADHNLLKMSPMIHDWAVRGCSKKKQNLVISLSKVDSNKKAHSIF